LLARFQQGARKREENVVANNEMDAEVKKKLEKCLQLKTPKSFFLFAGAGSGKTRSLVESLQYIISRYSLYFKAQGKYVAVITYTNAAAEEIKRRLDFEPLIKVSTIHSFIWEIIRGFDKDIRDFLKNAIQKDIKELSAKQNKGRSNTKAYLDRERSLEKNKERLDFLSKIKHFIYNPNGDNIEKNSLNHSEVIKLGAYFISNKKVMQNIIINRFPILLIDESQDTNKELLDAFFILQKIYSSKFILGLFGDMMQRIYSDGKEGLGSNLPSDWIILDKKMNHRSQNRIVDLINNIRAHGDGKSQHPRIEKNEGIVRLFVLDSSIANKDEIEKKVQQRMFEITGASEWNTNQAKTLILEHRMAAKRIGFLNMFDSLNKYPSFKTGFLDGSLNFVSFFADIIYPLFTARDQNDQFQIMHILKKYALLLSRDVLKNTSNQMEIIKDVKSKFEELYALYKTNTNITFLEILREVQKLELFAIPYEFDMLSEKDSDLGAKQEDMDSDGQDTASKKLEVIREFLEGPFRQIQFYSEYINNKSSFATHQGVKGLEFDHVMVIIDDEDARGFMFKYERLFEVEPKTPTDCKNIQEGKETVIDRTRRLFYVACSRARESLALVIYSKDPEKVEQFLVEQGWISSDEVIKELS